MRETLPFFRAEALANAIARLPDPEKGPPIVEVQIDPFRRLSTDPIEEAGETAIVHFARFRREVFGRGSRRWHEYVFDLPTSP